MIIKTTSKARPQGVWNNIYTTMKTTRQGETCMLETSEATGQHSHDHEDDETGRGINETSDDWARQGMKARDVRRYGTTLT